MGILKALYSRFQPMTFALVEQVFYHYTTELASLMARGSLNS